MTEIGSIVDGKYEILKQIGKGGMSIVYLAMDQRLNKQWAVKEIKKQATGKKDEIVINSLLAEANLMKKLDHPALPRIVDIIDNGSTIYVIMDYIEGESLDKILLEYGAQPEELVIEWAKQLCDALSYLHSQKPPIIYRDMKPANIMLKPEGNLKVIDFGIAREYKEKSLADTTVLGTSGYAPPEQHGSRQTDERSDIFALGMTLHHLLTGIDPRPADYIYAPVRQWNPELSEGIEAIINRCTALDPEDRYQSCSELMYDLEHPDLITQSFKKKQKHRLWMFGGCALASLLFVICGFTCNIAANSINNSNYDALISVVASTSYEDKINSYREAIDIYPYDTRGYMKLLEAYENEGTFRKKENDEFLALYNANKSGFEPQSVEVAELNYRIGMMYFNYYTNEDGSSSFSNRVQKAYPFFASNHEEKANVKNFSYQNLSECYYQICEFYKTYILNSANVKEASKEDYLKLFSTIEQSLKAVKDVGAYDQLSLYNGVFMLLYDQRSNMVSVNVEQDLVLSLLKGIQQKASGLSVQKEQSKKLKDEILLNYDSYRDAIIRINNNAKERAAYGRDSLKD